MNKKPTNKSQCHISYANRGMGSQLLVASAVELYNKQKVACIQEIDTPKTILKDGGFYKKKSTVDFIGIAYTLPVAFDVKSTRITTRFDLNLISEHQFVFLNNFHEQGGVSFILLNMVLLKEWYVLPFLMLKRHWIEAERGGKKSIPYEVLKKEAIFIKEGGRTGLDFLEFIKIGEKI